MTQRGVDEFFDSLSSDYTAAIERCFPRYREMLWALLKYLPDRCGSSGNGSDFSILELGCGTGNLTVLLAEAFPDARLEAVDVSSESLSVCAERLSDHRSLSMLQSDMRELSPGSGSYDLVISSIAIHHLTTDEKQAAFKSIHNWLRPGGTFTFADQFRGANPELYERHLALWRQQSLAAGASEQEFEMWVEHQQEHDHHDPLYDQMRWLTETGFEQTDCVWRYLLWSVIQAHRP